MLRPGGQLNLRLRLAIYPEDDPHDSPTLSTSGVPPESRRATEARSLDTQDHRPRPLSFSRQRQRRVWQVAYRYGSAKVPRMPCRHRATESSRPDLALSLAVLRCVALASKIGSRSLCAGLSADSSLGMKVPGDLAAHSLAQFSVDRSLLEQR